MEKVAIVTGTTSGIGYETCLSLARDGFYTFATVRDTKKAEKILQVAKKENLDIEIIELDVDDEKSISTAIQKILSKKQRIDVLVNNAGWGLFGSVEDVPIKDFRAQFETNFFGIISIIQNRNYVEKDEKKSFHPTEIGILVNDLLVKHFPKIVDIKFTAHFEEDLDEIASGQKKWVPVISKFYEPFAKNLKIKEKEVSKKDLTIEKTDKICPLCKKLLVIKLGRFGKFLACSGFPECRYTEPIKKTIGVKCPKCSMRKGEIVEKRTKKGKIFYGCSNWPKCDFALWDKPTGEVCSKCGSLLVITKKGQTQCSNKECEGFVQNYKVKPQ